jgi:predicted small secreted protein
MHKLGALPNSLLPHPLGGASKSVTSQNIMSKYSIHRKERKKNIVQSKHSVKFNLRGSFVAYI